MTTVPTGRIPRLRWGIGVLLGVGVLINYFDRINLSVAAPQLKHDFGLTDGELGWLFSGFFWSYALLQIPTGMILDRFGVTRVNRISTFFWSITSAASAFAVGLGSLLGARILLGVAEGPAFPASSKATGYWFPRQERAFATSIFDAAAKFSNVIGIPLVALIVVKFGWRWGFGVTAVLSFLYFLAFTIVYRDPSKHKRLSVEERDYIREGGATPEGPAQGGEVAMLGYLLRNRKVWGLTIGFAAYGYSFYLFLTWLPNYLVETMHMSILKSAGYTAIPWIFATIADLVVGGWLIDHLIARGHRETPVRMTGTRAGHAAWSRGVWRHLYHQSCLGSRLDLHRAQRPGGCCTGGLVDPLVDCAAGRDRDHRRHHEFPEQYDGCRGTGYDGLRRWRNEILHRRVPDCRSCADRRHRRLPCPAGQFGADP